jgi:hypothetical protein
VEWIGGNESWLPLYELYPLDDDGFPILPRARANIFASARRGKAAIEATFRQNASTASDKPDANQMELL